MITCLSSMNRRAGIISVSTMAKPEKIAPATKYGGKMVVCQPGRMEMREVQGHDGVHREDQRRRQAGEQQVGDLCSGASAAREPRQPSAKMP